MAFKTSNLEELIAPLRLQIGDLAATPTYSDETLHMVLRDAVSSLMRRWNDRYYVDVEGVVHRNSGVTFIWSSPPVIQAGDRRPIIVQASIMIKTGKKFSEAGNAISWKDDEISYSNRESAIQTSSSLKDDIDELNTLLPVKLAGTKYGRLYGWDKDWD